jgi:hypothetical protein
MVLEPGLEPVQRSTLGDTGSAVQSRSGMVCYQDVAGLAVKTTIGGSMDFVFGALSCESKVYKETLLRNSSFACAIGARRRLLELGGKTNRTGIKNWFRFLEMGDTFNMLVSSMKIGVTGMAELLVPQQLFGMRV